MGAFDGKGYTITGLYINRPDTTYIGLFGYTGSGSEIKNVGLEDVNVSGYWQVGGLVGVNDGKISSSYSTGSATCDFFQVGGLAGSNEGLITDSYSAVNVNGHVSVGGLVGSNLGTILNSYSTGSVSGNSSVGGLVGLNTNASVNFSFWDIETSGQTTSARGTGKTTAEMKTKSTFISALGLEWNFCPDGDEKIWAINDGETYPCLNWQQPGCTCYPCGDGNLDVDEECDDGNNRDGDRCSSICKITALPWERVLIPIVVVIATLAIVGTLTLQQLRKIAHRNDNYQSDDFRNED